MASPQQERAQPTVALSPRAPGWIWLHLSVNIQATRSQANAAETLRHGCQALHHLSALGRCCQQATSRAESCGRGLVPSLFPGQVQQREVGNQIVNSILIFKCQPKKVVFFLKNDQGNHYNMPWTWWEENKVFYLFWTLIRINFGSTFRSPLGSKLSLIILTIWKRRQFGCLPMGWV